MPGARRADIACRHRRLRGGSRLRAVGQEQRVLVVTLVPDVQRLARGRRAARNDDVEVLVLAVVGGNNGAERGIGKTPRDQLPGVVQLVPPPTNVVVLFASRSVRTAGAGLTPQRSVRSPPWRRRSRIRAPSRLRLGTARVSKRTFRSSLAGTIPQSRSRGALPHGRGSVGGRPLAYESFAVR